ncbi:Phosphoribosylaminoimidazolesuccinocarboxamide synthase [Saliniradius amylolyticus]|uniref:Phosphoribosylaminoimidazolesuccinocarboxamide synthase n=1 Tax=Saliniradius amylolyticus TaxID=2183582 RepID=A0A2S2E0T5_9ALTE|nr:AI-2E family transporter [Saliniradius amylolyticus]AWL11261.1 Phosphoribosylaminoimidazolesuccinocarboxamide synthase [Saliniradius amylolyticus]
MIIVGVTTLHLAQGFLLPVTIAGLLALMLSPAVKWLMRCHCPKPLASVLMILLSIALIIGALWLVMPALGQWMSTAPEKIEHFLHSDQDLQSSIAELSRNIEQTSKTVDKAVEQMMAGEGTNPIVVEQETWPNALLSGLQLGLTNTLLILALTLFLLISGDRLAINLIKLNKDHQHRKRLVSLFHHLRAETSRYLGAVTLVNLSLGVLSSTLFWFLNVPLAWMWLVLITLLRFIPYVGLSVVSLLLLLVCMTHFPHWWQAALPVGLFLVLATLYGFVIDTLVHSVRLSLNPVVVFVAVIFWGWLWGIPGAIIAVPLLTIMVAFAQAMGWQGVLTVVTRNPRRAKES